MSSLLITPKDQAELDWLADLLARLNIETTVLDDENTEDAGLGVLMSTVDRNERVSRDEIFSALRGK
jgi:hypothetical protein